MAFKFMRYIKEYNQWHSTSTIPNQSIDLEYKSTDKITYNIHKVTL